MDGSPVDLQKMRDSQARPCSLRVVGGLGTSQEHGSENGKLTVATMTWGPSSACERLCTLFRVSVAVTRCWTGCYMHGYSSRGCYFTSSRFPRKWSWCSRCLPRSGSEHGNTSTHLHLLEAYQLCTKPDTASRELELLSPTRAKSQPSRVHRHTRPAIARLVAIT